MEITAIRLRHVKKIGAQGLALESLSGGLNVLSEPNEFGKSTIFEAFRHGLLTKHSSKKEPVKALMPKLGGGAPLVEIDLTYEDISYRIRKQFLSQASTTITNLSTGVIIKTADDAQDWIKSAIGADEKLLGPTGLLWVTQGQPLARPSQSEDEKNVFSSVLDNEITSVVSGQKGRQIAAIVSVDLGALVTAKTGRPTKAYKIEVDKLKQLNADKLELSQKMTSAESTLSRLAKLAQEKATFNDPERDTELQRAFEDADENYESAVQAAPKLEQLQSASNMKAQAFERLAQKVKNLERNLERGRTLSAEIETCAKSVENLTSVMSTKLAALVDLTKTREAAERDHASAESVLKQAYASGLSKQAQGDAVRYEQHLKMAAEARDRTEAMTADLAAMPIDNLVLRELNALSNDVQVLGASRTKSETTFKVTYEDGSDYTFTHNGSAIDPGRAYPVHANAAIDIPGKGRLLIQTTTVSGKVDPETAYIDAKATLKKRLSEVGVDTMGQAVAAEKSRYDLKQKISDQKALVNRYAPDGIQALKDELARTRMQVKVGGDASLDVEEAQALTSTAVAKFTRAKAEEKTISDDCQRLRNRFAALEAEKSGLERELRTLCEEIGLPNTWEQRLDDEKEASKQGKNEAHEAQKLYAAFKAEAPSLELAQANRKRCKDAIENRKSRLRTLTLESEGLKGQLVSLSAEGIEGQLSAINGEIERAEAKISRFEDETRALTLLKQTLEHTQQTEKIQLFGPVTSELSGLISQVVSGAEVRIGDDFAASEIIRSGLIETVDSLSGGTQEQIAILTRLAFARLKARQGHPTPVILDDALVFSDDTRIASMFTALNLVANDLQIIVLTCRQKSFEGLGGNVLSGRAWPEL